jgi:hypothetical protein
VNYTTSPPYVFIVWCLIKHENYFIFTFMAYITTLSVNQTQRQLLGSSMNEEL